MANTLKRTQRNWERFAAADAMSAILLRDADSSPWAEEEFFRSGVEYCQGLMDHILAPRLLTPVRGRALDFGCGMGRLTNGLGPYFEHVVGVDISSAMLQLASSRRKRENLSFVHNVTDDLAVFPDDSFDFVLSVIVLQHVPPAATLRYIGEFLRVLKPGGVVVFQLPVKSLIVDRGFLREALNELRRIAYRPRRILEIRSRLRLLFGLEPRMEMRGIPREEVSRHIGACGGRLLDTVEDKSAGDFVQSYLYLVTKD